MSKHFKERTIAWHIYYAVNCIGVTMRDLDPESGSCFEGNSIYSDTSTVPVLNNDRKVETFGFGVQHLLFPLNS
jgi:hypothetical protein